MSSRLAVLVDILRGHGQVWNHDVSYDVPIACDCGAGGEEDYEFDHAEHLADVLLRNGFVR